MNRVRELIKKAMAEQKISTYAIAKLIGSNQSKVHRTILGLSKFEDTRTLLKIAECLGICDNDITPVIPITGTSHEGMSFSEKAVGAVDEQQETQTLLQRLGSQDFSPQVLQMAGFLDLMTKDMTDEERDAFARELFEDTVRKLKDRKK